MGRYGRHNNVNYRNPNNSNDSNYRYSKESSKDYKVTKDFDSSSSQVDDEQDEKQGIVSRIGSNIKERYQKYNSEDARKEREINKLTKRTKTINKLSYSAKKEGLKAQIRKSKQTANTGFGFGNTSKPNNRKLNNRNEGVVHFPKNNYGSMDRMFGIGGGGNRPAKMAKKKPSSEWSSFDRMFGI